MGALGARLARRTRPGVVYHLSGPLAAGKTTLVRGFLRELGWHGVVKSPTFALVETYDLGAFTVHHFDLYRIAAAAEIEFLGMRDFLEGGAVCLIEWPERAGDRLPEPDLRIAIELIPSRGRRLRLEPVGAMGLQLLPDAG